MQTIYLTEEGKKQLEEKLNYYRTVRRPEVTKKIGIAREFGDLSENIILQSIPYVNRRIDF